MTKYKIALVPFPFDDLSSTKVRPVVCLTDPIGAHGHIVVAFITSQMPAKLLATDLVMDANTTDFSITGLRVTSTLQLHRLMTVTQAILLRQLGELPPRWQRQAKDKLRILFEH